MKRETNHSLISRAGMALSAVLFLAILNILVSYLVAENLENDAVRINLAGSLRMQSYKIANQVILNKKEFSEKNSLLKEIENFENRLYRPVLNNYIKSTKHEVLKDAFSDVEQQWKILRPRLQSNTSDIEQLLTDIDNFVVIVDKLVKKLERQTENKFQLLRIVQGICLILSIIIVSLSVYDIFYRVVIPLQNMVAMASRVRRGDFATRLKTEGDDELTLLASTFNDMVESLDQMYHDLEDKVQQKTLHLEQVQKGLLLLYQVSTWLSLEKDLFLQLEKTIYSAKQYFRVAKVELHITQYSTNQPFLLSTSGNRQPLSESKHATIDSKPSDRQIKLLLERGNEKYGYLVISDNLPLNMDQEKRNLLSSLVDTIVSALARESYNDQQRRLALIEERTVIARELHDSLAQSLSFTKIQVSRLQMLRKNQSDPTELESAIEEIRNGIQAAYGQLREILATFRLQLESEGLKASLNTTIGEFHKRADIPISLTYELDNISLTPNEEIHVLQIIREALSNVIRHSNATCAEVFLTLNDKGLVQVNINDNGKGFADAAEGPNHYGRTIMSERANILGGSIQFLEKTGGGAMIELLFKSNKMNELPVEVS